MVFIVSLPFVFSCSPWSRCLEASSFKNTQTFAARTCMLFLVASGKTDSSIVSATSIKFSKATLTTCNILLVAVSSSSSLKISRSSKSFANFSKALKNIETICAFFADSLLDDIAFANSKVFAHFVNIEDAFDKSFKRIKFAPRSVATLKFWKKSSSCFSCSLHSSLVGDSSSEKSKSKGVPSNAVLKYFSAIENRAHS